MYVCLCRALRSRARSCECVFALCRPFARSSCHSSCACFCVCFQLDPNCTLPIRVQARGVRLHARVRVACMQHCGLACFCVCVCLCVCVCVCVLASLHVVVHACVRVCHHLHEFVSECVYACVFAARVFVCLRADGQEEPARERDRRPRPVRTLSP
jgi:hypothetical protein